MDGDDSKSKEVLTNGDGGVSNLINNEDGGSGSTVTQPIINKDNEESKTVEDAADQNWKAMSLENYILGKVHIFIREMF